MRLIPSFILLLLFALAATVPVRGAAEVEPVPFQAILVIASDEGATDSSLAALEPTLKRVLRFKCFRRAGAGAATVSVGGNATATLGRGHSIDLWVTRVTEDEIVFGVRWFNRDQTLANTRVTRPRRANTVIGGPSTEDGTGVYAVIVTTN